MRQFLGQCKWEMLRQLRNRRFFVFSIIFPIGFYLLFSSIFKNQANSVNGTPFPVYYMMSMATFGIVGGALNGLSSRVAFERTQGWLRLVQTTPLPNSAYFASKVVAQLFINLIMMVLLFLCGAVIERVHMSAAMWIGSGAAMVLGALPFIALGILIGLLTGAEAAQVTAGGLYFILSIAGGLWFPLQIMPSWLQHLAHGLPTFRLADISWRLTASQAIPASDFIVLLAYFAVFGLLVLRVLRRLEERAL
ncbi:MAG: ABC transporter permease [Alicyclobacillus sp.]|nr:ABC transporter permease [Alicyclobacillus sp.]